MLNFETYYGQSEPIAVIGLSGRFPGSDDLEQFWQNLTAGYDASRCFTESELQAAGISPELQQDPHFVNRGAPLEKTEYFDAALFGYSRQEAELIDPQQRLFLQGVWHALEHAGFAPKHIPHKTGIFASARMSSYPAQKEIEMHHIGKVRAMQKLLGNDKDYLATRVAYQLGFTGPAMTIQTACSSSLVAVHTASESLRSGECSVAIAGGVGITFPQTSGYIYQPGMIFSPDGICRPFDAHANGTYGGNGFGIVVLRRLEDAIEDGDPVIAVLRGSAVNNDGHRKVGFTAPSVEGQVSVIREAMRMADVCSDDIGMIEAHATATPLGDPIELEALRQVFSGRSEAVLPCAIGSLKGNIGHLDTAAGIAGLIKAIYAVNRAEIPPSIHFSEPNTELRLEESPFFVPGSNTSWPAPIRTAGVSSFGLGGTNCHVIVQSLPEELRNTSLPFANKSDTEPLLLLSAASLNCLKALAGVYAGILGSVPDQSVAHTVLHGRQLDLPWRLAMPLTAESAVSLTEFSTSEADGLMQYGESRPEKKLAWLFSGIGTQHPGMGQEMYSHSQTFAAVLDRCELACTTALAVPLKEVMFGQHSDRLTESGYIQAAIVAYEIAMAEHWKATGLLPDMIVGHSCGEYAAAVIAGFYTIEQMMPVAAFSGFLMDQHVGGKMIAVFSDDEQVNVAAKACGVELAAVNGLRNLSFSGRESDLDDFIQVCTEKGIQYREIKGVHAAHSSLVDKILEPLSEAVSALSSPLPGQITLVSGKTGDLVTPEMFQDPQYWSMQLRQPVMYQRAVHTLIQQGITHCLEVGATSALSDLGDRELLTQIEWIPTARTGVPDLQMQEQAAATLFVSGYNLPWPSLFQTAGSRQHLPLYRFDAGYYWYQPEPEVQAVSQVPVMSQVCVDSPISAGRQVALDELKKLDLPRLQSFYATLSVLHNYYVNRLVEWCLGSPLEQAVSSSDIMRSGRILPRYRQLMERLLDACVEDGYYATESGSLPRRYRKIKSVPPELLPVLLNKLRADSEGLDSIADTVERAGAQLGQMMTGEIEPVSVIFPQGQSQGVEVLYQNFSFGRYFNQIAAAVLQDLAQRYQTSAEMPLRIIEVGGGTGGTTSRLLPALASIPDVEYVFTDISPIFTRRAADKFSQYNFVSYREFDLQQPPEAQGLHLNYYDIVIAANVVHATQHIGDTLAVLRTLLRSDGHLLMREITQQSRLFDFVFGPLVLPLHDEESRKGKLFLPPESWHEQCLQTGFESVRWLPDAIPETKDMCEHIILASLASTSDRQMKRTQPEHPAVGIAGHLAVSSEAHHSSHYQWQWLPCDTEIHQPSAGAVLCAGDLPAALANELKTAGLISEQGGCRLVLADPENPLVTAETIRRLLNEEMGQGIILVTHHAWAMTVLDEVHPAQRSLWGFLRAVRKEFHECLIGMIDLTSENEWQDLIPALKCIGPNMTEVIVRQGYCYQPALTAVSSAKSVLPAQMMQSPRWHIVTGGFGALGRMSAEWLIAQGAECVAILAPRCDQAASAWMENLNRTHQAEIKWIDCDCADAAQCQVAISWLETHDGIDGMIHSAGILDDAPVTQLTDARLAAVFAVKARAAEQFYHCLQKTAARYLIFYSSAAATLGAPGQAAHALASGYLDGLADDARGNTGHLRVISIAWGAWHDVGLAAEKGMHQQLAQRGMGTLSTEEGLAHLAQSFVSDKACRLAMRLTPVSGTTPALNHTEAERSLMKPQPSAESSQTGAVQTPESLPVPPEIDFKVAGAVENWLTACIHALLRLDEGETVDAHQELFQLGLDSLTFLDLSAEIEKQFSVTIDTNQSYDDMTVAGLAAQIRQAVPELCAPDESGSGEGGSDLPDVEQPLNHDADRYAAFPLTPIQHAYWLGRTQLLNYGGVACHVIFEWDCRVQALDPERLEADWNQLLMYHDMLRMVIDSDGQQRILENVPYFHFTQHDLRGQTTDAQQTFLTQIRESMCYRVLPTDCWPLFEIEISWLDEERYRLHINLDLLQFDTRSFKILFDDWYTVYQGHALPEQTFTFRDYCLRNQVQRQSTEWKKAWCYWQDLLIDLPDAPCLPLSIHPVEGQPQFTTYQYQLPAAQWEQLKHDWKKQGITPSAGLLTLFSLVLGRWARSPSFTLNLTYFNRQAWHPDVERLIGDFTSVMLVDVYLKQLHSLKESMLNIQRRLWQHLGRAQVNGVEVLREWGRFKGGTGQSMIPIVFTSMLGMTLDGESINEALGHLFGEPVYRFAQTPQVWLDHQVMEGKDGLTLNWFCMDGVFEEGLTEAMFLDYQSLINRLCGDSEGRDSVAAMIGEFPSSQPSTMADSQLPASLLADLHRQPIETIVLDYPGIRAARLRETEMTDTPLQLLLEADPVYRSEHHLSSHQWLPEISQPSEALNQLADEYWQRFENRALQGICQTLWRHQLMRSTEQPVTLAEMMGQLKARPRYEKIVNQWLALLCDTGLLRQENEDYYPTSGFISLGASDAELTLPDTAWEKTLWHYLEQMLSQHESLFSGDVSPLSLLFDSEDVTEALYSQHPVLCYLNQCAAGLVKAFGATTDRLNILEIGAGTGATTRVVLPEIADCKYEYTFTDMSHYFLDHAEKRFGSSDKMRYQIFDINAPVDFSQHPEAGYDLIIASNVIHDAGHIGHALRRIGSLLKQGGYLIMIEATERQSAMQLATVGFIEGLSAYRDERILENKSMLDVQGWRQALTKAGFDLTGQWPQQCDSPLRQTLFLAGNEIGGKLDLSAVRQYLAAHEIFEDPSLRLTQCENISAEISRTVAVPHHEATEKPAELSKCDRDMIEEVSQLWSELLGHAVDEQSDFFTSGGDSLIATRMISQLNQCGYTATLQQIFSSPRLADFCAHLSREQSEEHQHSSLVKLQSGAETQHCFLVHASDGDPAVYLPLSESLPGTVWGLQALDLEQDDCMASLIRTHLTGIQKVQQQGPYLLIGWSYGAFIAASLAHRLYRQGSDVRLILIDPVCRKDFVHDVDEHQPEAEETEQAAYERARKLMSWLAEKDDRLPDGIQCLWLEAERHPQVWTPPEVEWRELIPRATDHHRYHGDHWSVIQDRTVISQLSEIIRCWTETGILEKNAVSEGEIQ